MAIIHTLQKSLEPISTHPYTQKPTQTHTHAHKHLHRHTHTHTNKGNHCDGPESCGRPACCHSAELVLIRFCVCMCVCLYDCIHVYLCMCVRVCMYVYVSVFACVCVCLGTAREHGGKADGQHTHPFTGPAAAPCIRVSTINIDFLD